MIRRSSRSRRMTNTTIPPTANRREFKRTFLLTTRPPDHCRRKWTRNSTSTIRWERAHTINERSPRCGALPFRATCGETSPRAISTGCIATRSRVWRAAHFRRGGAAQGDDLLVQPRGFARDFGRLRAPGTVAIGQEKGPLRILSELMTKHAKAPRRVAELFGRLL